jgi:hypothetical protein
MALQLFTVACNNGHTRDRYGPHREGAQTLHTETMLARRRSLVTSDHKDLMERGLTTGIHKKTFKGSSRQQQPELAQNGGFKNGMDNDEEGDAPVSDLLLCCTVPIPVPAPAPACRPCACRSSQLGT